MIRVRGLEKVYRPPRGFGDLIRAPFARPDPVRALCGVDFDVEAGHIFGLLGPNGAGKTTLLKILTDLCGPTAGAVEIAGHDLSTDPDGVRGSVGHVPSDERSFFWRLSALENLRFFGALHSLPRDTVERRIWELLHTFEVDALAELRFGVLSSGQKKLLTVVRALIPDPPVLILDEPTNSLDPSTAQRLMSHVREVLGTASNKAIVWATHRLEEVVQICDQVLLLDQGTSRFVGSVEEFTGLVAKPPSGSDDASHLLSIFESLTT